MHNTLGTNCTRTRANPFINPSYITNSNSNPSFNAKSNFLLHSNSNSNVNTKPHHSEGHDYEDDNAKLLDELEVKVGVMKQITLDIKNTMSDDNSILDDLDSRFDLSNATLRKTTQRIKNLLNSSSMLSLWKVVLFAMGVFFFVYFFLAR